MYAYNMDFHSGVEPAREDWWEMDMVNFVFFRFFSFSF